MDRRRRSRSPEKPDVPPTDPRSARPTRVVLHLTPEAVGEGFFPLDDPARAAERLPELAERFGRCGRRGRAELVSLASRAAVAPLHDAHTTDPTVIRYLRELNGATYRDGYRPPDLLACLTLDFPTAAEARRFVALVAVRDGVSAVTTT